MVDTLGKIMMAVCPDAIVTPHPWDMHSDHWTTNVVVTHAWLDQMSHGAEWAQRIWRLGYLVHWPAWPGPLGARATLATMPPPGLTEAGTWWTVTLPSETIWGKRDALLLYASQVELIKPFMLGFVRSNEIFGELPYYRTATSGTVTLASYHPLSWRARMGRKISPWQMIWQWDQGQLRLDVSPVGQSDPSWLLQVVVQRVGAAPQAWQLVPRPGVNGIVECCRQPGKISFYWREDPFLDSHFGLIGGEIWERGRIVGRFPLVPVQRG